jgi:putative transposase
VGFPDRFGLIQDARSFCIDFFEWYNTMHHHGSLGLLTPFDVHYGLAAKRTEERTLVLRKAFEANPERFVRGAPKPPAVPKEVWINKPSTCKDEPEVLDINF